MTCDNEVCIPNLFSILLAVLVSFLAMVKKIPQRRRAVGLPGETTQYISTENRLEIESWFVFRGLSKSLVPLPTVSRCLTTAALTPGVFTEKNSKRLHKMGKMKIHGKGHSI